MAKDEIPPVKSSNFRALLNCNPVRRISELKFDPRNPRLHSRRQVRKVAEKIKAVGFNVPVLSDSNLNVITAQGYVLAAKFLGLTEAQARAFMVTEFVREALALHARQHKS